MAITVCRMEFDKTRLSYPLNSGQNVHKSLLLGGGGVGASWGWWATSFILNMFVIFMKSKQGIVCLGYKFDLHLTTLFSRSLN